MSKFKLHKTKYYTRHSDAETGKTHCYRCDEILDNRIVALQSRDGKLVQLGSEDDGDESAESATDAPVLNFGAYCALMYLAGK